MMNMKPSGQLLKPPIVVELEGPTVFLAGPIQGSRDWQTEAATYLQAMSPGVNIADPRRSRVGGDFVYAEQVDWETHYLEQAGHEGVILFWLAKEAEHNPERAFGQTTRVEIGEWMTRARRGEAQLVVGIEDGFSGGRYIRYRLNQIEVGLPVVSNSLAVACALVALRIEEKSKG
jgi:hypothetical protein